MQRLLLLLADSTKYLDATSLQTLFKLLLRGLAKAYDIHALILLFCFTPAPVAKLRWVFRKSLGPIFRGRFKT